MEKALSRITPDEGSGRRPSHLPTPSGCATSWPARRLISGGAVDSIREPPNVWARARLEKRAEENRRHGQRVQGTRQTADRLGELSGLQSERVREGLKDVLLGACAALRGATGEGRAPARMRRN